MEFCVKFGVYEEIELRPTAAGLIPASVWKLPNASVLVVLAAEQHKKMPQDGVESVQIRIKRALNKRVREDGSIWLNENEYELIYIKTKSLPKPRQTEAPNTLVSVTESEITKKSLGKHSEICVKCGAQHDLIHYHDVYEVCFRCWVDLDAAGMDKWETAAKEKNMEILKRVYPYIFK